MGAWDLIRTAARGDRPSYVYHGFSVRLPPEVHALVHDESLPEHVRGFHLARHLLTHNPVDFGYPHMGELLGQDWHRDGWQAAEDARNADGPGRTSYVLKALHPEPEHILSDQNRKGHPLLLRAGAPVRFVGLNWEDHASGGDGELEFPEPVTGRA